MTNRMKKLSCLAALLVLIPGCEEPPWQRSAHSEMIQACVTDKDKETLRTWMSECISGANPKSDEEPEDWIRQCERTGVRTICPTVPAVRFDSCKSCRFKTVPCADIVDTKLKRYCPDG